MKSYDVIIIGGGMMGTNCAYFLTKEGLKVAIVERGDIASGTCSHTDAYIGYAEKQPGVDALQGYHSVRLWLDMAKKFDYDMELQLHEDGSEVGFVYFCESEAEMVEARKQVATIKANGMEMEMIESAKELHEREPNAAPDLVGGIWSPRDAVINPYRAAFGLIEESRKTGLIDVYTRTEVTSILQDANTKAVMGVTTNRGEELRAPKVVNACGCWAPFIGAMVGMDIPIEPRFGQLTVTEKAGRVTQNRLCMEYGYFLTKFLCDVERPIIPLVKAYNVCLNITSDYTDNTIVGGCRLFRGFSIKSEYKIMQAIAQRGTRFYPMLKDMNCIRSFAGIRPYCLDHLPIVSDVEEVPGFYMAAGHEGDGITLGPITGLLIAQYITGKPLHFEEAKELAWARFKTKDIPKLRREAEENTKMLKEIEKQLG